MVKCHSRWESQRTIYDQWKSLAMHSNVPPCTCRGIAGQRQYPQTLDVDMRHHYSLHFTSPRPVCWLDQLPGLLAMKPKTYKRVEVFGLMSSNISSRLWANGGSTVILGFCRTEAQSTTPILLTISAWALQNSGLALFFTYSDFGDAVERVKFRETR